MSKTTPVQIVNKNGVRTTVHKRIDNTSQSGKASRVPKPSLATAQPQDNSRSLVEHSIAMSFASHDLPDHIQKKIMDTIHPDTIARLERMQRNGITNSAVTRAMSWSIKDRSFALLNTMMAILPDMENMGERKQQDKLMYILLGMQEKRTPGTPVIDITNDTDPRSEGIRPLVRSLLTADEELTKKNIDDKYRMTVTFKHPGVGNLMLERPEQADEIFSLYRSHRSFDRELFEDALDNGVSALNEGKL